MASDSQQPSTSTGRFSAQQARTIIQRWLDLDSDEGGDSDSSVELDLDQDRSRSIPLPDLGSDSDSDTAPPPAKRPRASVNGKGKGVGKSRSSNSSRSRLSPESDSANAADQLAGGWRRLREGRTNNTLRFHPLQDPGVSPNCGLGEGSSALECLDQLLDMEVKVGLVQNINSYAHKRITEKPNASARSVFKRWKDITVEEFNKFVAVLIVMGLDRRPAIVDYWSMSPEFYTPWYHAMFSRERFQDIYHSMLHAGDEDAEGKDKIEPFMNLLLAKFRASFYPFRELSIDEMVIGFKGRWQFKQYNASKPSKYHIKTFGLCDSATGYVLNILTYFGANTSYDPDADHDSGQAVKIFDTLLKYVGTGHKIFADRYYTTRQLVDHLLQKKQHYTGTLMANRRDFPPQIKSIQLQHREMQWFMSEAEDILCVAFRDKKAKKCVLAVSTDAEVATTEVKTVAKPTLIHDYNQHMNGCDLLDQKVTYYPVFARKTIKWWKKIFFWLLEVSQVNAFILYTLTRPDTDKKISLKAFKRLLVTQIAQNAAVTIPQPNNNNNNNNNIRAPGRGPNANPLDRLQGRHIVSYVQRDRACEYCSKNTGQRKRTHFVCLGCTNTPHLHPKDCFQAYHSA